MEYHKCNDCPNMAEATLDGVPLCPGCYHEEVHYMQQAWEDEAAEGDWADSPDDTDDTDDTDDQCPRCDGPMRSPLALNALSRSDNATYICGPCGNSEGIADLVTAMARLSF